MSEQKNQPVLDLSSKIIESVKKLEETEIIINQIKKLNNGNRNNG